MIANAVASVEFHSMRTQISTSSLRPRSASRSAQLRNTEPPDDVSRFSIVKHCGPLAGGGALTRKATIRELTRPDQVRRRG
jgi:hypothetical protein